MGVKPRRSARFPALDCSLQPPATCFRLRAREARVLGGWRGQEREETGLALRVLNPGSQFLSVLKRDAWPIRMAWAFGPPKSCRWSSGQPRWRATSEVQDLWSFPVV